MKFVSVSGDPVPANAEKDFTGAPVFDRIRTGNTGIFFPAGFRMKYIPYDSFDRAFLRIHAVDAKMCCSSAGFDYFSLVLMNGNTCVAEHLSENRKAMQAALEQIKSIAPAIAIGVK